MKERDALAAEVKQADAMLVAEANASLERLTRAERLEAALREIAKPYAANQSRLIHSEAQIASIARAALKGADHE